MDEGADILRAAERWWREDWDHALGLSMMLPLQQVIRNCPEPLRVQTGHYVPERGEEIATRALEHFGLATRSPASP